MFSKNQMLIFWFSKPNDSSPQHKNSIHILNMRLFPLQLKCMYLIRFIISRRYFIKFTENNWNRVPKLNYCSKESYSVYYLVTSPSFPALLPSVLRQPLTSLSLQINLALFVQLLYKLNNTI